MRGIKMDMLVKNPQMQTDIQDDIENEKLLAIKKSLGIRKKAIKAYKKTIGNDYSRFCNLIGLDEIRELIIALNTAHYNAKLLKRCFHSYVVKPKYPKELAHIKNLDRNGQEEFTHLKKAMNSLHSAERQNQQSIYKPITNPRSYGISGFDYRG